MYRVKKTNGWNRYKIQKRFMFIYLDVKGEVYTSKSAAGIRAIKLNEVKL